VADAILALDEFIMGLEPQEPWGDAGMDLPPSQPAGAEQRRKTQGNSSLSEPPRQAPGCGRQHRGAGGDWTKRRVEGDVGLGGGRGEVYFWREAG